MTDSMNFGPDWIRNLSSEGSTSSSGGSTSGGTRYQLAEYRYGREEMLALFDKNAKPPASLTNFKCLYSEQCLTPLALLPPTEEEMLTAQPQPMRSWQNRAGGGLGSAPVGGGRGTGRGGGSMERGGRGMRSGRGGYQYGGGRGSYDSGWGGALGGGATPGGAVTGDQPLDQWSPRKEYGGGRGSMETNWRRSRTSDDLGGDGEGWRRPPAPNMFEKWSRSTSWREPSSTDDDRGSVPGESRQRGGGGWSGSGAGDGNRFLSSGGGPMTSQLRGGSGGRGLSSSHHGNSGWDHEDRLPEWATENPADGGGSFDDKGAFHGSDDEQQEGRPPNRREPGLQKSTSQQHISMKSHPPPLSSSKSSVSLVNKPEDSARKKEAPRDEDTNLSKENSGKCERKKSVPSIPERIDKEVVVQERAKSEGPSRSTTEKSQAVVNGPLPESISRTEESDFEKLQEDFVLKLVVDEEPHLKSEHQHRGRHPPGGFKASGTVVTSSGAGGTTTAAPPNLVPPPQQQQSMQHPQNDKWYYQDPQGQTQGPFTDLEMTEWYKAGYFSNQLKVRRQHDDRFFLLGELIGLCGGTNPFSAAAIIRVSQLKPDPTSGAAPSTSGGTGASTKDPVATAAAAADLLQFQYLSQMAAYKQAQARAMATEPWGQAAAAAAAAALQQEMVVAQQRLMMHQQVPQDLQFIQQPPTANPLMHMINQMQQVNKLPGQGLVDKPPNMPSTMDPHLQLHMGSLLSMQNRIPPAGLAGTLPTGLTPLTGGLPPDGGIPGLQAPSSVSSLGPNGLPLPSMTAAGGTVPRPPDQGAPPPQQQHDQDPISSLLKQLQQQKQQSQQIDSLWHQNQFNMPPPTATAAPPTAASGQWPTTQNDVPLSMWDVHQQTLAPPLVSQTAPTPAVASQHQNQQAATQSVPHQVPVPEPEVKEQPTVQTSKKDKEKDAKKDDKEQKEAKKKKELEEKQAKKEAEEKRKQELKKQEAEKKAAEEKKRKEDERVRKELEKAKREAEEKRQRELEEKRRQKEQRKLEEENRKKAEEQRKAEVQKRVEEDRLRAEREAESKREQQARVAKAAPWSQANSAGGLSLAEIQKAEREKRAQEAAQQAAQQAAMQRLQEKELQQLKEQEKSTSGLQLSWAKKPMEQRKVKSLAEIQAEEQERLAKQAAELRLQKEKEQPQVTNTAGSIWNGQNLSWAAASAQTTQWSSIASVTVAGFWEDSSPGKPHAAVKPSTVTKSNSTNTFQPAQQQQQQLKKQQQQQAKTKPKKEEVKTNHNNNNGPATDEFTTWCYKTLSNISTDVDIPTFVSFLRDIESAFDVREYCKEYLGESGATHQWASTFLERRRQCRPQRRDQHKDDMCSPAPALTPGGGGGGGAQGGGHHHSGASGGGTGAGEFQEVKGKNKKNKKSKMLKVDSRILGFNVTSAPDRINVGDRDYGDNS